MLKANAGKSFVGIYVLGMGFTFDDDNLDKGSSPISEMHHLIAKDPRNAERIFPYLGGEELNASPTHAHHRYVINFGEMTEQEARQWPDLMKIVEAKARGTRAGHSTAEWWQFERLRPELYEAIRGLDRVLAHANVSKHLGFAFVPSGTCVATPHNVFAFATDKPFVILQCRAHEAWARFFGSSMKDDLRYTPSDCFETFPFPPSYEANSGLEAIGKNYHDFRAALMIKNNEGLTKTYNRFHNPEERSPEILKLRELHAQMDRAVLDAYGWTDIKPVYDFREQLDESIRLTWGEDTRDEVLARLLELNRVIAEEEAKQAPASSPGKGRSKGRKKSAKVDEATGDLFSSSTEPRTLGLRNNRDKS